MEDIIPLIVAQATDQRSLHALTLVHSISNRPATIRLYHTIRLSRLDSIISFLTYAPDSIETNVRHVELELKLDMVTSPRWGEVLERIRNPTRKMRSVISLSVTIEGSYPYGEPLKEELYQLYSLLCTSLFTDSYEGPKFFRLRYVVEGESRECPFKLQDRIMESFLSWPSTRYLDLPFFGKDWYPGRGAFPFWLSADRNQDTNLEVISISGLFFWNWHRDRMGDWLEQLSSLYVSEGRPKKSLRLEIRKPIDQLLDNCLEKFVERKDPAGIFDMIIVDDGRENEDAESWRFRVMEEYYRNEQRKI
ncbi:hypothetical protein L486_01620 [Kwoniella mangroviensis CBS 10435]|uniref:Uncharacterized protein n=1 Tax=Kwoniella mangroviensis CBS 10435 TaxID=1331196 RepID=A0A1B9J2G7_9TREE|nr:hypothetical protein L486_01620 [Kwoniella mangroviensis CBS 10435]